MSRRIEVDADALYQVLKALNGTGYAIRELQATRDVPGLMDGNPIDLLVKQYNEGVAEPETT